MIKKQLYLIFVGLAFIGQLSGQTLKEKLAKLAEKYPVSVEQLKVDSLFSEKYLILYRQPLDHNNPEGPFFEQRVFLSHLDFDRPVVFITEGYAAHHATNEKFVSELAGLLETNQVCVEHRYFGTSVPDSLDWTYLTVKNSAFDYHGIVQMLKEIYKSKWINTGISKGGQTAMYYRYFFPDDIDISVPYVAPLNFSIEDKRVYYFLENVSTKDCRERVFAFQKELISNKATYLKPFEELAARKNLTYRMGIEKAFELTVLEYSFAFFQWGSWNCDSIPVSDTEPAEMISHLDHIAGIKWISNEGIQDLQPFFYQAMREIGFYGYDIEPFKDWTTYTTNPTFEFSLPVGINVEFEPELMQQVDHFIRHQASNMLFIYGEYDPWSAPAVDLTMNTNSVKVVKPAGSHRTRISNLDSDQREFVMKTLNEWLQQ